MNLEVGRVAKAVESGPNDGAMSPTQESDADLSFVDGGRMGLKQIKMEARKEGNRRKKGRNDGKKSAVLNVLLVVAIQRRC